MKKSLLLLSFFMVVSCSKFYDRGGITPEKLENPTLSENYVVMGAYFDKSVVEKKSFSEFAKDKCIANGYKGYKGYAVSKGYTAGWMLFGIVPMSNAEKLVKIWCQ